MVGGAASPDLVGRTLAGRYRLVSLLGVGGMGAVFEGFDERLQRSVAVKVLSPGLASDATSVARFVREARASAALSHPCVVTVFDTGTEDGTTFLVMERLHGESLADRMRRGPLSAGAIVRIAARVLEGLEAAHCAGIVHRDVKPANVFLCEPDGTPKLLDFGIAAVSAPDRADPRLTETGAGMGTPLYVAPEQLRGEEPDPRADLYSLAAILYEAVSGRPVFVARSVAEAYAKKLTETPPSLLGTDRDLPGELVSVIERGLLADPGARFASAAALRSALLAAVGLSDAQLPPLKPVTPTPLPSPATTRVDPVAETRPATPGTPQTIGAGGVPARHRAPRIVLGVVLAGVVLAAGAVGLAAYLDWHGSPGSSELPPPPPIPPPPPAADPPRVGLRTIDAFQDARGSARAILGAPAAWDAASADFERAIRQPGAPLRWHAARHFCEGQAKSLRGDLTDAVAELRSAIGTEETWAAPHVALAMTLTLQGNVDGALDAAHRAEQLEPDWWVPVAAVAGTYAAADRLDDAIQEYRRALALAPEEPAILGGLALALHAARLDEEAERYARLSLERDPDATGPRLMLAERALERGDGEEALREATRAASVSPHGAAAQLARADALALLGRDAEALDVYRHVIDLVDRTHQVGLPPDRLVVVREHLGRGELPPRRVATRASVEPRSRPAAPRAAPPPGRSRGGLGGGGRSRPVRDPLEGLDF